jgi:RES domain-containing protein
MLVHLQADQLLRRYVMFEVSFDQSLVKTIAPGTLPKIWRRSPAPATLQLIGDHWSTDAKSAVLQLPSAIVPAEWIYLLNPAHPGFANVTFGPKQPIKLDPRLARAHAR